MRGARLPMSITTGFNKACNSRCLHPCEGLHPPEPRGGCSSQGWQGLSQGAPPQDAALPHKGWQQAPQPSPGHLHAAQQLPRVFLQHHLHSRLTYDGGTALYCTEMLSCTHDHQIVIDSLRTCRAAESVAQAMWRPAGSSR